MLAIGDGTQRYNYIQATQVCSARSAKLINLERAIVKQLASPFVLFLKTKLRVWTSVCNPTTTYCKVEQLIPGAVEGLTFARVDVTESTNSYIVLCMQGNNHKNLPAGKL